MVVDSSLVDVILSSNIAPALSKDFLDIEANSECKFTRRVYDRTKTLSISLISKRKTSHATEISQDIKY